MSNPTYVTMPSLAPLKEFTDLLEGVWQRGILTHNGPLVQQFENSIINKLGLNNFVVVSNGTIALQMAIKALGKKGKIITTPFTWVATISAIQWEGCEPIFCDVDINTFNIDVTKIEALITEDTIAIMPVHVFGNPCEVKIIEEIAKKHNIKVIYDAAHAIGSTYNNESLLNYGDISATSLHATKLLNTAEGGGCITNSQELKEKLLRIRFFGHDDTKDIVEEGFNGKLTEIHAALGLVNLKYFDEVLEDRITKYNYYKNLLSDLKQITFQKITENGKINCSYFPIVFQTEENLLQVESALNKNQIFARRYFYPSVNTFTKIVGYQPMPISEDLSKRILCLPLYKGLSIAKIDEIIDIVKCSLNG